MSRRRALLGVSGGDPSQLIVNASLDGTINNLLGNQYTLVIESGSTPTFVTDGGRQVYINNQTGQFNARALTVYENSVPLSLGSYAFEFEFRLLSLINYQSIFTVAQSGISAVRFNNMSGSFNFVMDLNLSGSILTTSGTILLSANTWYKARFEISPNGGNVTINDKTLSYTITGNRTNMNHFIGSAQGGWWGNTINGWIKDLKVWKLD